MGNYIDKYESKELSKSKYVMNLIQKGMQKFTGSLVMSSIITGFISSLPVIIASSLVVLFIALPEMFMGLSMSSAELDSLPGFRDFQNWGWYINSWAMGILGMIVTASIAKTMGEKLNHRLSFDRKMNENSIYIAGLSCYLMLSIIEISGGINTSGLGAQGILPGILVGISMPWIFYFCAKWNITIRMPKQVPQVISKAFLAIIPLFIALSLYGTIGYLFKFFLGKPLIPFVFAQLSEAVFRPINNSYGIIVVFQSLTGLCWFIGVQPEPIYSTFRTLWIENLSQIQQNALGSDANVFIESLQYSYGSLGGAGSTLAIPFICLLFCKSSQLKTTGKVGAIPIIFNVNEPVLFSTPIVFNPIFLLPMVLVPSINGVLTKVFVDELGLIPGSSQLPWATPWFLQAGIPHASQWQIWLLSLITLFVCFVIYTPFVLLQDHMLFLEEKNKLKNQENFSGVMGIQIIFSNLLNLDLVSLKNYRLWKKDQKQKLSILKKEYFKENKILDLKEKFKNDKLLMKKEFKIQGFNNLRTYAQDKATNLLSKSKRKYNNKKEKIINLYSRKKEYFRSEGNKKNKLENLYYLHAVYEKNIEIKSRELENFETKINTNKFDNVDEKFNKSNLIIEKIKKTIIKNKNRISILDKKIDSLENVSSKSIKLLVKKNLELKKSLLDLKINYQLDKRNTLITFKENKFLSINLDKIKNIYKSEILNLKQNFGKLKQKVMEQSNSQFELIKNSYFQGIDYYSELINENNLFQNEIDENKNDFFNKEKEQFNIVVLCVGAGSSAMLANAIKEGANQARFNNINTTASAYGAHKETISSAKIVIISPQLGSYKESLENEVSKNGGILLATKGKQYIELCNDYSKAFDFVKEFLK